MATRGHIAFIVHQVPSAFRERERLRKWLTAVAKDHGHSIGELNYVLMSDKDLLKYNREFLQHDEFTDVITFDGQTGTGVSGDVLMSLDRITDNAKTFGVSSPASVSAFRAGTGASNAGPAIGPITIRQ